MEDTIKVILQQLKDWNFDFEETQRFSSALKDVKIETIETTKAKLIRTLLCEAFVDIKAYPRLKNAFANNNTRAITDLAEEMCQVCGREKATTEIIMACIAELVGFASGREDKNSVGLKNTQTLDAHNGSRNDEIEIEKALSFYNSGDYKAAYEIVSKLAENNHPSALNFLGTMYQCGSYVTQDLKTAFDYYASSASLNSPFGKTNLGRSYFYGIGVTQDADKGYSLIKKMSDENFPNAKIELAQILINGYYVGKNLELAIKLYESLLSEKTHMPDASKMLGMSYIYGAGKEQNFEKGLSLLKLSADNNDTDAVNIIKVYNDCYKDFLNVSEIENTDMSRIFKNFQVAFFSKVEEVFDTIVKCIISHNSDADNGSNFLILSKYQLLLSLVKYLYHKAPASEQNSFMIVELIEAGFQNNNYESNLDGLFNMLEEKDKDHIALKHYTNYKVLSGVFFNEVLSSLREDFRYIGARDSIFKHVKHTEDLKVLSTILITNFGSYKKMSSNEYLDFQFITYKALRSCHKTDSKVKIEQLKNHDLRLDKIIENAIEFWDFGKHDEEEKNHIDSANITKECTACGKCQAVCPMMTNIIKINDKYVIGPNCLNCNACAEYCSVKRVERLIKKESSVNIQKQDIGKIIKFGKYDWRVLDVQNGKALLISKDVTHVNKPYNETYTDVTWESCTLRQWLNRDFLSEFSAQEQSQICLSTIPNEDNQWYGTKGGNQTTDRIFLLSLSEVCRYFGDSEDLANKRRKNSRGKSKSDGYCLYDQYNNERVANFNNSTACWWLRSPGGYGRGAAYVDSDGYVDVLGFDVTFSLEFGGVRPALWLNLNS